MNANLADASNNLGLVHFQQKKFDEAAQCFRQALRADPNHADAWNNLGIVFFEQKQLSEATECFRHAVRLSPLQADFHYNLGNALSRQVQLTDAAECFRMAVQLNPAHAAAYYNMANALRENNQLAEAMDAYQKAYQLKADFAQAHLNLGNVLKDQGRLEEAIASFRKALEIKPDYVNAHSNLIHTLHFLPDQDPSAILQECRRWNNQYAAPLKSSLLPHANIKSKNRRLRIGYVSADLFMHPVGRFLLPLLKAHDKARVETFCYASVANPDTITAQCREHADCWRNILGSSDEQVAQLIRQDRIDILVDLSLHTGNNRLLVFARKPAPLQVSYLAYCGTTGLDTMDYRLTDPNLDPPGQHDSHYSEQSIRLPNAYWCYLPVTQEPEQITPPGSKTGQITFGCLNNFCKVTDPTLNTWGRLLQSVPQANLLLHAPAGPSRDRVRAVMAQHDVSAERLHFVDKQPFPEYMRTYHRIDVALDPFPYGGATTTCDALWMGVPVVSLAGQKAVSQAGASILANVKLPELLAQNTEEYVRIAADLAGDMPRLSKLRASLRNRLWDSPVMDARHFAKNIEDAYRTMWLKWCSQAIAKPKEEFISSDNLPFLGFRNDDLEGKSPQFMK